MEVYEIGTSIFANYAWLIPFAYGTLIILAALWWLAIGIPFDRATYERAAGSSWNELIRSSHPRIVTLVTALVRSLGGNFALLSGVLIVAISLNGYRLGEKWTWFALLILPLHSAIDLLIVIRYRALSSKSLIWDLFLICFTLAGLILPFKKFFP